MQVGVLQSMQVGVPQRHKTPDTKSGSWTTSFFREPSTQPRWLYTTSLNSTI